jgi:penicillin-binding protein 2
MQLLPGSSVQDDIARLKQQWNSSKHLKTVRGAIRDRHYRPLAVEQAQFQLCISYELTSVLDERVRKAALLKATRAAKAADSDEPILDARKKLAEKLQDIETIIDKCTRFGPQRTEIHDEITRINDSIWNLRSHLAWKRKYPDQVFAEAVPDPNDRLLMAAKIDIAEMHENWPLLELQTDDDVFTAQFEFKDTPGVKVLPRPHRFYPYAQVAAQTIGWVGPATREEDTSLFDPNDDLSRYLGGEICGREDGIEYVCEAVLRGKRGKLVYDIDGNLISQNETQFGRDVYLTLDIELQETIEDYLEAYDHDPNCGPGLVAVLIDVATSDILALVSLPTCDLNRVRYDYDDLRQDTAKPLINRAINMWYPPGSVVKPLILIAGAQTGVITLDEVIPCPPQPAPTGWPNCWIYNRHNWMGHDTQWPGQNSARNAIRGSCNIYFSRLADRIEPPDLQRWLFNFGYGRAILQPPPAIAATKSARNLRQLSGMISNTRPRGTVSSFEQITPLSPAERRWFGIGHGRCLATPLQVANAMAAIARGGIYKPPQLFLNDPNSPDTKMRPEPGAVDLGISPETISVVREGMHAVVSETGGTAYSQFQPVLQTFAQQDVTIYGKTGSTERPDHAWFGGFAEDSRGNKIAVAIVVEGGQRGSRDAAPLARDIIQFCIDTGYLGSPINAEEF